MTGMKNLQRCAAAWAGGLACAVALGAAPLAQAADVPVANFTGFTDAAAFVNKHLSDKVKQVANERKLQVWVSLTVVENLKACVAFAGLTHQAPEGVNPRKPTTLFHSWAKRDDGDFDANECGAVVLKGAIERLSDQPVTKALDGIELTSNDGGVRKSEAADPAMVQLSSTDLTSAQKAFVFEQLHSVDTGKAMDYRHVQTMVFASGFQFKTGGVLCTVEAGLTARSPEGRNARWPQQTVKYAYLVDSGSIEGCVSGLLPSAMKGFTEADWGPEGLGKGFDRVREEGVPLPNLRQVAALHKAGIKARAKAAAQAARQAAPPVQKVTTRATRRQHCTNDCVNGSCVRTLADGTRERWQAPRRYNPFNSNWEWDITTNACGG